MTRPSWQTLPPHPGAAPARDLRRWGYGFGGALLGTGLLILALTGGDLLRRATRGAHALTFPGSRTLTLEEGLHVGLLAPGQKNAPLNVAVQESSTGLPVPVQMAPAGLGPSAGDNRPLFQFQILDRGDYLLSGTAETKMDVVLLHESLASSRSDLVVGILSFLLLSGCGTALIVATRRRARALAATGTSALPQR